jgi:hypothetical protein
MRPRVVASGTTWRGREGQKRARCAPCNVMPHALRAGGLATRGREDASRSGV